MRCRLIVVAAALACLPAAAADIVRCKDAQGGVTYQPAPCPDRSQESRPQIPTSFPEPNRAESQRIFEREAALDKRLEARRDRELVEQQMREARAEREADRQRAEQLAAQQQQLVVASPWWRYGQYYPVQHMPRPNSRPIR